MNKHGTLFVGWGGMLNLSQARNFFKGPWLIAFLFPLICFWVPYSLPLFLVFINIAFAVKLKTLYFSDFFKPKLPWIIGVISLGWMLLSSLWAPNPLESLRVVGTVSLFTILGVGGTRAIKYLPPSFIKQCLIGFTWGFWVSLAVASLEILSGGVIHSFLHLRLDALAEYNRGLTLLIFFLSMAVYASVSLYAFSRKTYFAGGIFILFMMASLIFDYDAGLVALLAMPGFIGIFYKGRKKAIKGMVGFLVLCTLGAPLIHQHVLTFHHWRQFFPEHQDVSWVHRLHIWSYVAKKIAEHPLRGWGINSARHEIFQEKLVWSLPGKDLPSKMYVTPAISLHPHNMALQIWLELGAVGAVLLAIIMTLVGRFLCQGFSHPWPQTCLASMFSVALIFGYLSYGIWQSWWYSAFCIAFIGGAVIQCYERIKTDEE